MTTTSPSSVNLIGVRQQVEQDLAEAAEVTDDRRRQLALDLVGELDALGGGRRAR